MRGDIKVTGVVAPSGADRKDESERIESAVTTTSMPRQIRRTRISAAWVGVMAGAVVLALLLMFILQNTRSAKISYLTFAGSMPLGIALLLAAIAGLILAGRSPRCVTGSYAIDSSGKPDSLVRSGYRTHRASGLIVSP
jgi:uncharacterized integral membrane protein